MFSIGRGVATFDANTSRLNRKTREVKGNLKSMKESFRGVGRVAGIAFLGLAAGAGYAVKKAGDAAEISSKFQAVFKEETDAAREFAAELADAVGRATIELQGMMSSVQDTFVPMGFARKEARMLSQNLTKLAIDVASFNNEADATVMRDFQSALVGNHETLRKYGVVIMQATLDQELLRMGIEGGAKAASNAQKVQARYNLLLRGTVDAQGDAVRTSDSFNNKLKRLKSGLLDASIAIGKVFLPAATKIVDVVTVAVNKIGEWTKNFKGLTAVIGGTAIALTGLLALAPKLLAFGAIIKSVFAGIGALAGATAGAAAAWTLLPAAVGAATFAVGLYIAKLTYAARWQKELNAAIAESAEIARGQARLQEEHEQRRKKEQEAVYRVTKRLREQGRTMEELRKVFRATGKSVWAIDKAMERITEEEQAAADAAEQKLAAKRKTAGLLTLEAMWRGLMTTQAKQPAPKRSPVASTDASLELWREIRDLLKDPPPGARGAAL